MIELGIDYVDMNTFKQYINDAFLNKIFTIRELEYSVGSINHLAGRFAAKEAVIKALSQYGEVMHIGEIEIYNDEIGRPFVRLLDDHKDRKYSIKISITHHETTAIAVAIALGRDTHEIRKGI